MKIHATRLAGFFEVEHMPAVDPRGAFTRLFCEREMAPIRANMHFTQINWSQTQGVGSVRGMHYQVPPAAEAKFIRCLRGRVYDVVVDLRMDSPTFLCWHAVELTEDNCRAVFVPEGFAHGFQTLSDEAHLLYMHTAPWTPGCEEGIRFDDPSLNIAWPLPVSQCSERDRSHALIDVNFTGLRI
ncbi:MAG: dTDP-4-dehydrorhamnose 3,5-epimerase family protein [Pseudomonadaceae bacterium]